MMGKPCGIREQIISKPKNVKVLERKHTGDTSCSDASTKTIELI
jgi:hypothetical protein